MKTMSCKQLGGACDKQFSADTFEEMANLSQQHGKEMFEKNDAAHLEAMGKIHQLMQTPEAMEAWFAERKKEFDELPDS